MADSDRLNPKGILTIIIAATAIGVTLVTSTLAMERGGSRVRAEALRQEFQDRMDRIASDLISFKLETLKTNSEISGQLKAQTQLIEAAIRRFPQ